MLSKATCLVLFNTIMAINIRAMIAGSSDQDPLASAKAEYKSGEIHENTEPITLDKIKEQLRESGIFDWRDPTLSAADAEQLAGLFDAVEIMTSSRMRQPASAQNMFASLRLVERAVKKQLKEGRVSETLASKFNWDRISNRHRRQNKPMFYLDNDKNMRVFYIES